MSAAGRWALVVRLFGWMAVRLWALPFALLGWAVAVICDFFMSGWHAARGWREENR